MNQPDATPSVRPPAVAGMFYPAEPDQMRREVSRLFDCSTERPEPRPWRAALIPHAGWVYSGRIAASVLERIRFPDTVIVLCPKHTPGGARWAVAPYSAWGFPGGEIRANTELAAELVEHISRWEYDALPHAREHAIEVQLPLLAYVAPDIRVVGITIGGCEMDQCRKFATGLAGVLADRNDVMLLVSSDMNHFATDRENRRLDEMALAELDRCDPEGLYSICREHNITMCGMLCATTVLLTLRKLGLLHRSERVAYGTSADASGDNNRVVGYAGMLFGD